MQMVNTLLAENAGRQCAGFIRVVEEHHNLAGDGSCELDGVGDLPDAEARLQLLRDNGGPTDTLALGFGSEALDAAGEPCPEDDQRNLRRPVGRACDIGAVERRRDPVVTTHLDGDDGECDPDDCTLRDALLDSERDAIILLKADTTYEVRSDSLELRHERQVVGAGARSTKLAAIGDHRVLTVPDGSPTLSGVRVTGGAATVGGGILVGRDAIFSIVNSAVAENAAADGGGIASQGHVNVVASTISSNRSETGGGLLTESEGSAYLVNSTVTGNAATSRGGGLANRGVSVATLNTTIAGNSAASRGDATYGDAGVTWLRNTIVAGEGEVTCDWGAEHELLVDHSLADDDDCFAPGGGNLVQDPKLGPLASGLGQTDVYPLLDGSPAIDAGDDGACPETDQRNALRFRCDIGAYEGTAATGLRVVTLVLDGPARPSDFTVQVYSGGEEVRSDPGSASGTSYALDPGSYRVLRTGSRRLRGDLLGRLRAGRGGLPGGRRAGNLHARARPDRRRRRPAATAEPTAAERADATAAGAGGGRGGQRAAQERDGAGQGGRDEPVRRAQRGSADPGRVGGRYDQGPGDDRGGGRPVGGFLRRDLPAQPDEGREAVDDAHAG